MDFPSEPVSKKPNTVLSTGNLMVTDLAGIRIVWSTGTSITYWREKRSQESTMSNYWAFSTPNCRKTKSIWQRKNYSPVLVKGKLVKLGYEIHFILLYEVFLFWSQTWKRHPPVRNWGQIRIEKVIVNTEVYFSNLLKE